MNDLIHPAFRRRAREVAVARALSTGDAIHMANAAGLATPRDADVLAQMWADIEEATGIDLHETPTEENPMTEHEITAALIGLQNDLTEKLGNPPYFEISATRCQSGMWSISLYKAGNCERLKRVDGTTLENTIAAAGKFISAMPDPEAAKVKAWHRKLGDVIDEGHALHLPEDVMQPLRAGSLAMTENLLTHE